MRSDDGGRLTCPHVGPMLLPAGFTYGIPWWDADAPVSACNLSVFVVDPALLSDVLNALNGSLSGVTIRSGRNPMDELLFSSALGLIFFGVYPVSLFAALAMLSAWILGRTMLDRDAPRVRIHILILSCNIAILSALLILFCAGGGSAGLLLPDMREQFKTFNLSALTGTSAGVDVLLALYLGNIASGKPPDAPVSLGGLFCFASLVSLDIGMALALMFFNTSFTTQILPTFLIAGELASVAFLAWRSLSLQLRLRELVECYSGTEVSIKVARTYRRFVVAGVSVVCNNASRAACMWRGPLVLTVVSPLRSLSSISPPQLALLPSSQSSHTLSAPCATAKRLSSW
jgi:hypothetical protein